jgi:hypothetical protein
VGKEGRGESGGGEQEVVGKEGRVGEGGEVVMVRRRKE